LAVEKKNVQFFRVIRRFDQRGARGSGIGAASVGRTQCGASAREAHDVVSTPLCKLARFLARAIAGRMRDNRKRQVGVTERVRLGESQSAKRGRAYGQRCQSELCGFYTVVDTPRRASASFGGSGDDEIGLIA